MCGLLLYFDRCAQIDVRRFKEALDLMHHRGPDNQSIFTFKKNLNASPQLLDNSVNDVSNVTLAIGHNRLSIFDLSNHSNQPLLNTSQDKFLIYNGEFYNFSDYSDSETQNSDALALFKLLSKNPTTTFDHVNGMWASVFGDLKKRKLYLSRDRYGKKPLYYFQNKTSLIVSSEIKAIFHILGKPRVVNPNILANFIYGKLSPFPVTTETFYESIHSINPGCNYVYNFENGQFRLDSRVVWKELQDIGNIPLNESNLEEQISFELRDSIKLRMNADVDVAIPISGGIDSSFIVGTANEILDRSKLKLYTCHIYGKEGLTADLGYARRIAKKLDLPLIEVETNQTSEDDFLKTVQNLVSIAEIPINYFLASIPTFQLSQQMHKNGIKVSVDGIGADEVFAGYKDYASLALANATSFKPFESMRFFAKWFKTVPAKRHEQVILFLRLVKKMIFNHGEHHIQNTPIDLMLPHFSNDKLVESIKRAGRQTFTRNNICTTSERQLHDLTRYQIANSYFGRVGLINSGGASGSNDLQDAVSTAVINKRAGGMGLISGRKAFQKPLQEGIQLLNAIQDVYLSPEITIA